MREDENKITTNPESLLKAILQLRDDFDSHDHDGFNSKSFNVSKSELVQSRTVSIKKTSFTDDTEGFWLGYIAGLIKMYLGKASSFLKWDGSTLSVKGNLERSDFQWTTLFESIDGYSSIGCTLSNDYVQVVTGATANDEANLTKILLYPSTLLTWDKDRRIKTRIYFNESANQTCYIIVGDTTTNARKFGFYISGSTLNGVVANGTSTDTLSVGTVVAGNSYSLEARMIAGTRVDFYVDGTLAGSISAYVPTGTTSAAYVMNTYLKTTENATKTIKLSFWDFWQAA